MNTMTFNAWMTAVDIEISNRVMGMTSSDLPDCYADWHEDGLTPKAAAIRAIRNAKDEGEI
jgi:hypothetical protein